MIDYILFSLKNLINNKLRTFLTLIGIAIGIAAVVAIFSVGIGAKTEISRELEKFGGNDLMFAYSNYKKRPGEKHSRFRLMTQDELKELRRIECIRTVSPMIEWKDELITDSFVGNAKIYGVEPIYLSDLAKRELKTGRLIMDIDLLSRNYVCLLTEKGLTKINEDESIIGKTIKVKNHDFLVIGILRDELSKSKLIDIGDEVEIFIPFTSAQKLAGFRDVTVVTFQRKDITQSFSEVREAVNRQMKAKTSFRYDYEVKSLSEELKSINKIIYIITSVIGAIGTLSLVVGGIGVMNIMLVSVTERTKEIGIRIAVGAKTGSLIWQFLIETMTVCLFGGFGGIGLGILLIFGISKVPKIPVMISYGSILAGIVFSLLTGLVFGIYPAIKASRLDPIECLRYE